ncbi:MAG TPA: PAS domain-containing sensor histidine kinase, partial [Hydrogenophaga sp.]
MTPEKPHDPSRRSARARWAVVGALVFMTGLGLVLLFLLTLATRNRALYEQNFVWLASLNVAVAALLLLAIIWLVVRLALRFRLRKFGSRLLLKLAAIIGLVGVLPGVLIYTVSYQFVSRSIESWFDVRVESALVAGLNLGRTALDTLSADLSAQTRLAAEELGRSPQGPTVLALERLREQMGASDMVLWSASGQALASAGTSRFNFTPVRPSSAVLRSVRANRVVSNIEGLEEAG